ISARLLPMRRRLMSRVGASSPSFSRSSTSMPPALSSAGPPRSAPSCDTACSGVLTSIQTKEFMAWSSRRPRARARRGWWPAALAHADGVVDGVGDGGGGRHGRRLADAARVGGRPAVQLFEQHDVDARHVEGPGDLVLLEVGVEHPPRAPIHAPLLEERVGY